MKKRVVWLILPLLVLFAALACLADTGAPLQWELAVYDLLADAMSPALTGILRFFTHLGDPLSVVIFCCGLLVIPGLSKSYGLPVTVSTAAAAGLNQILKRIFRRERPDILRLIAERGYSFPSGHAMSNSALYLLLAMLILRRVPHPIARRLLAVLCIFLAAVIGISRVYLGVHYASDVLAGWALGSAIALAVYTLWDSRTMQRWY